LCGSPSLLDHRKCYYHQRMEGRRMRAARARALCRTVPLDIPPLEDLDSVQIALQETTHAMLERRIDRQIASLVLYALQQAATNLMAMDRHKKEFPGEETLRVTRYPSYEHDFGLDEPLPAQPDPVETPYDAAQKAFRHSEERFETILAQAGVHLDEEKKQEVIAEMAMLSKRMVAIAATKTATDLSAAAAPVEEAPPPQSDPQSDPKIVAQPAADGPQDSLFFPYVPRPKSSTPRSWDWKRNRPLKGKTARNAAARAEAKQRKRAQRKRPQPAAEPAMLTGSGKK